MSWPDAVRGKKRRARRSPGPSKERLVAAPAALRTTPRFRSDPQRQSDDESTWSTVTGNKDATKDVATYLIGSLLGDQNLSGSDWDTVKAGVVERFRDWGKRRAREERAGIKAVSDAILLLSKPLSCGPGVTAALTSLRKKYRVLLQRRWDSLRATARAEQWEMEAWCSKNVLRRHLARKSSAITSLVNPNTGSLVETQDEVL
ncbi:hypothetical protein MRX96_012685 [Rhipicephalus microplus]